MKSGLVASCSLFITSFFLSGCFDSHTEVLEKKCLEGDSASCSQAAHNYFVGQDENGDKVTVSSDKSNSLYLRACELKDARVCDQIGRNFLHFEAGLNPDLVSAMEFFDKACALDYAPSCTHLAGLYAQGKELRRNLKKAKKYFDKGCTLSDGLGCFYAGLMHEKGEGVKKNYSTAFDYYSKGCALDDAQSCTNIGAMYYSGLLNPKDYAKANESWICLRKSCKPLYQWLWCKC